MSAITQEQLVAFLKIFGQSKLISELLEQSTLTTDSNYLVINQGQDDAKKIKIPLIRGFKGNYNASTNTPSLSNGTGLAGDIYIVSVAGNRDFGNGFINLIIDDIIWYNGTKWIKLTKSLISDIQGLQEALDSKISGDLSDEFYLDENSILRLNVSTYRQPLITFTTGDSQIFTLDFEPTFILGIYINGQNLNDEDFIYTTPNTLEILGTLENGDKISFMYETFVNSPV